MSDTKKAFRFNYKKYESKSITIEALDKIFDVVMLSTTGTLQTIKMGLQLVFAMVYLFARKNLIEEKLLIAKQEYESGRSNQNSDDIIRDDLD